MGWLSGLGFDQLKDIAIFQSPEHALSVAFAFEALRIEPRNATTRIINDMRARRGMYSDADKAPSDMSPQEWHAETALIRRRVKEALAGEPILFCPVLAEYSHGIEGAQAIQEISQHLEPDLSGSDRLLCDLIVMRAFRGGLSIAKIAAAIGVSRSLVHKRRKRVEPGIAKLRQRAVEILSTSNAVRWS